MPRLKASRESVSKPPASRPCPTLVNAISELEKRDAAAAQKAFAAYDSAWNGIETYVKSAARCGPELCSSGGSRSPALMVRFTVKIRWS
jgi:hypothetical protein